MIEILAAITLTLCPAQGVRRDCVVDGDTLWIGREKIRLENVSAPELDEKCEAGRELAIAARDLLLALLNGGELAIERHGRDDYGRTLARVSAGGRDVGEALVARRVARPWQGGPWRWC